MSRLYSSVRALVLVISIGLLSSSAYALPDQEDPPASAGPSDALFVDDQGNVWPIPNSKIDAGSEEKDMLDEMIEIIECLDPALAQEMTDTLTTEPGEEGKVQVVDLDVAPMKGPGGKIGTPRGFTDSTTIGLDMDRISNGDQTLPEMATVLAHEFQHAKNGKASEKMMDPTITTDPPLAGNCAHADMVADGVDMLIEMACTLPECNGMVVNCLDIQAAIDNALQYYADIAAANGEGCGTRAADMANLELPWDCCCLCGGSAPPAEPVSY